MAITLPQLDANTVTFSDWFSRTNEISEILTDEFTPTANSGLFVEDKQSGVVDTASTKAISLFHDGSRGTLYSDDELLLSSDNILIGSTVNHLRLQYAGGGYRNGTLFFDDTDFIISTDDYGSADTRVKLDPQGNTVWVATGKNFGVGVNNPATEIDVDGAITIRQSTEPNDPIDGSSVIWSEGHDVKVKSSANGTTTTHTLVGENGIDAETLNGETASFYLDYDNFTNKPTLGTLSPLNANNVNVGVKTTAIDDGVISAGSYTPDITIGNMFKIVNGGAFTFSAPTDAGDYTMVVKVNNSNTAGVITMSGFTLVNGDEFTTTDADNFVVSIIKIDGSTIATTVALQ